MTETLLVEIVGRELQADGVVVLDLVPVAGSLPAFEPGAHVDLRIGPDLVRQYSLCGHPGCRDRYRIGILLEPASRGGSASIHAGFRLGERFAISLPRNNFPLSAEPGESILIGGGIGITPLLAMAHHLHEAGRRFSLHYCARSRAKAAFLDELAAAPFHASVHVHFDDEPPAQRLDPAREIPPAESGAHLYICGPTGFMDWLLDAARARHYPEARLHREYFTAKVDASGDAFEVVLARSGRMVPVAASQSIVDALRAVGIRVDVSCEQGVCGTCLCTVLDGIPDHRDSYMTDEEHDANDQITPCCSRSKTGQLVLDL